MEKKFKNMHTFEQHIDKNSNIHDTMTRAVEYYKYIDEVGYELADIILDKIKPLLDEGKFDEAKKMVRDFYEPSRYKTDDDTKGDVIFIEYDMILANINQKMKNRS